MKAASRVLLAVAGIALVGGLVLGALPVTAYPLDAPPDAAGRKVNCGSAFSRTRWSGDDACEGRLLGQAGVSFMALALGLVSFVLGVGALVVSTSRDLRHGRM